MPVAVIGASPGMFGAVWAQAELKKVVALIGACIIDAELPVSQAATRFDLDGRLTDDETREGLAEAVNKLVSPAQEREATRQQAECPRRAEEFAMRIGIDSFVSTVTDPTTGVDASPVERVEHLLEEVARADRIILESSLRGSWTGGAVSGMVLSWTSAI